MVVDTAKINKLKDKFQKYPPYAIKQGLKASSDYMNTLPFKSAMYPPSQSGQPFVWSTDKQRRFVLANIRLPSVRTFALADAGEFDAKKTAVIKALDANDWLGFDYPAQAISAAWER